VLLLEQACLFLAPAVTMELRALALVLRVQRLLSLASPAPVLAHRAEAAPSDTRLQANERAGAGAA